MALFTVAEDHAHQRRELSAELARRLEAFRQHPLVDGLCTIVGDPSSSADVALMVRFRSPQDLARLRQTPEHRSLIDWYQGAFDDSRRHEVNGIDIAELFQLGQAGDG